MEADPGADPGAGGGTDEGVSVGTDGRVQEKLITKTTGHVRLVDVGKVNFTKLFRDIDLHVDVGLKLYKAQRNENDAVFCKIFSKLKEHLDEARNHQVKLSASISKYDFVGMNGIPVKANGYRSMLFLMFSLLQQLLQCLQKCAKDRTKFRVPVNDMITSLSLHCNGLHTIERMAYYCCVAMESTPAPHLFNYGEGSSHIKRGNILEALPRNVFYGHLLGFQYAGNIKPVLKMLAIGLASYEEWYQADKDEPVKQLLASLWKGSRYLQSSTRLGLKLDQLTTDTSVQVVKAFWSLPEQSSVQGAAKLAYQSVEVSQWVEIPSKPLKVPTANGEMELLPPSVHIGFKPINMLLLSYRQRGSQPAGHKKKSMAPSPGLIIHFHGGGYVAQGPLTHSSYLRQWAYELDVPVVSVDYSLSPEAPYPRALEECVYAYSWILQNLDTVGSTGEKIVLVGDSAGGNFCITSAMKLKQLGIRQPTAVLSFYPSVNLTSGICPSRISSIVDPILPLGVLIACQHAYCNKLPSSEDSKLRREYRQRIHRSQGYYYSLDPDNKPSSSKRSKRRMTWRKSKNGEESTTQAEQEKPPGAKVPPPRPPPPSGSICKVDLEAVAAQKTNALEDEVEVTNTKLQSVCLDFPEASATSGPTTDTDDAALVEEANSEDSLNVRGVQIRREPDDKDKLTPTELEELVNKVMKLYESDPGSQDPFMSPLLASDDQLAGLPPVHIIGAALDSLLDDSVSMAQRLKAANQPVTLNVIDNLPHGFLSLVTTGNNTDYNNAIKLCVDYLKGELGIAASPRSSRK